MPDLDDGESVEMKGSAATPYILKNVGGVYSCTCPAWRNQSIAIEKRTCKHLRKLRGDEAEDARTGGAAPVRPKRTAEEGEAEGDSAPPLLLAESWDFVTDPTGWWLSEKLDGVRAYWDGKQFWSRLGNLFHAPDWFTRGLPDVPLDGELWLDRKRFQRTVSIVRRQDKSDHWKELRYVVFDVPKLEKSFEKRMDFIRDAIQKSTLPYALAHTQELCKGIDHLRAELARLEALGGEGLMMRKAGSKYESGRSSTLLKVKTFHDAEARILKHQPGAGRHKGRLGALLVELDNGTTFSVGTGFSDAERDNPPPVGSTITFRYQELSDAGVPRFPSYIGVRAEDKAAVAPPPARTRAKAVETIKPAKPAASGTTRRFEYTDEKSNKFWEITVAGTQVDVRYGRIGTDGQTTSKTFPSESAATQHTEKLIGEKTEKGYEEVEAD